MIVALFKLATLPDEVRTTTKIRCKVKLDCNAFADISQLNLF